MQEKDRHIRVSVQRDHLEELAKSRSPFSALAELVWNSFDADASSVDVVFVNDSLGALSEIRVRDDGHGFLADEAVEFFGSLGGSWKAARRRSRNESRLRLGGRRLWGG